jgi:endonuclease/exonuclease/phosphatase family metal-dependent hydrolase
MSDVTSPTSNPSRRWRIIVGLLAAALIAVIIRDGADRKPADPSRPLNRWGHPGVPCDRDTLRITSFNIHSGKGDGDAIRLDVTAKTLGEFEFAGLYEVRSPQYGLEDTQSEQIANLTHSGSIFAPTETHWWHEHFGNAVVTRWKLGPVQRIPLPGTRGKAFRNMVLTDFPWRDRTVKILSTHIDREDDRERQLELAIALFLDLEPPAILMGDLNTPLADPQLTRLRETPGVRSPLHDALDDVPADNIDWMFTRGLKTVSASLTENAASDHPVLRAEVAIEEAIR